MATPTTTTAFLLLTALLLAQAGASHAGPPAAKPKMIPRPVPGVSKAPASSAAKPSVRAASTRRPSAPTNAAVPVTDDVRILKIFRQGTLALPPTDPAQAASGTNPPLPSKTAPENDLRSGRVRILTQAEAEVLAAQSR